MTERKIAEPFRWTTELGLKAVTLIFLAGGFFWKLDGVDKRLERIERFLDAHVVVGAPAKSAGVIFDCNQRSIFMMTKEQRDAQVRILEEDAAPSDKLDANGRAIEHGVVIMRVGDGAVLGKYRNTEVFTRRNPETKKLEEVELSGFQAAQAACEVNNWKVARY